MSDYPILAPAAVLVLWSMIMLVWMIVTRFAAFSRGGVDLAEVPAGSRYAEVEAQMPERVNWKSHNYTHLMEQPTLFYATVIMLAMAGDASAFSIGLAWAYTGLRIVHSIWQATVNRVAVRARLFALSSLCLLGLAVNAVWLLVR